MTSHKKTRGRPAIGTQHKIVISDDAWDTLGTIADAKGVTRADLVRRSIDAYITTHPGAAMSQHPPRTIAHALTQLNRAADRDPGPHQSTAALIGHLLTHGLHDHRTGYRASKNIRDAAHGMSLLIDVLQPPHPTTAARDTYEDIAAILDERLTSADTTAAGHLTDPALRAIIALLEHHTHPTPTTAAHAKKTCAHLAAALTQELPTDSETEAPTP